MIKKHLLVAICLLSLSALASEQQEIQLLKRVEIRAKNGKVFFSACQLKDCRELGNAGGYLPAQLKAKINTADNLSGPARQLINEGVEAVEHGPTIFAMLLKEILVEGDSIKSVYCSLDSKISTTLKKGEISNKPADYIYRVDDFKTAGCGGFVANSPDFEKVISQLNQVLK